MAGLVSFLSPNTECGITTDGDGPAAWAQLAPRPARPGAALHPQLPLSSALLSEKV